MMNAWLQWANQADWDLRVFLALGHFVWQGALIGGIVWGISRSLRGSPTLLYGLHCCALFSLPICLATTIAMVKVPAGWQALEVADAEKILANTSPKHSRQSSEEGKRSGNVRAMLDVAGDPQSFTLEEFPKLGLVASDKRKKPFITNVAPIITIAYLLGVALFLIRIAIALRGAQSLRHRSRNVADPELLALVEQLAKRLGLRSVPDIAVCHSIAVPAVIGVLKPIVLAPPALLSGLSTDQFAAVIAHEFAHIRRHDLILNLAQRLIEALLFFHPVTWFISRRMTVQRELCCDDLVLRSGSGPMDYAGALLHLAESCRGGQSGPTLAVAATGENGSQLELRIRRLLEMPKTTDLRVTRLGIVMFVGMLTSAAVIPALAHHYTTSSELLALDYVDEKSSFTERLEKLESQSGVQVGRDKLAKKYEVLLSGFPNHPDRARAMFLLAHLWESEIPAQNAKSHPELTIKWLRRAYHAAKPGSAVWVESGLHLNNRIYRESPDEAKSILNAILAAKTNVVDELQVWNARQAAAINRNDWNEAERIARMMLDWCRTDKCPKEGFIRSRFFREVQSGASVMLTRWHELDQVEKIDALLEDYGYEFLRKVNDNIARNSPQRTRGAWDEAGSNEAGSNERQSGSSNKLPRGIGTAAPGSKGLAARTHDDPRSPGKDRGLSFLDSYSMFDAFSLDMTEEQLKQIIQLQQLDFSRSKGGPTYFFPTGDGFTVIVMFGNNGDKCSGIQRVRGEPGPPWRGSAAKTRALQKRPSFGEIRHGLNVGLTMHQPDKRIIKGDWVAWEFYIQNAGEVARTIEYLPSSACGRVMSVTDSSGKPVRIPGTTVSFHQEPIRLTLQPDEIYIAIEGFQIGRRENGRIAGPLWIDPVPGQYQAKFELGVKVSGHDPGDDAEYVLLKSGEAKFRFDAPNVAKRAEVENTFLAFNSRQAFLDIDTGKALGPLARGGPALVPEYELYCDLETGVGGVALQGRFHKQQQVDERLWESSDKALADLLDGTKRHQEGLPTTLATSQKKDAQFWIVETPRGKIVALQIRYNHVVQTEFSGKVPGFDVKIRTIRSDGTLLFLRGLRPDFNMADPVGKGRQLAEEDRRSGLRRILYFGRPLSVGRTTDEASGLPLEVIAGCTVTGQFVKLVESYNQTMRSDSRSRH
ncbi:MAG: M56 family metallopeptidase [Planctomycetota bacterium]